MSEKPDFDDAFASLLPSWWDALMKYDEKTLRAWDERSRRLQARIATPEDQRIHDAAIAALKDGQELPVEARRMPKEPPLKIVERTFHPDGWTDAQRCVAIGIPPLIAERIYRGEMKQTRATKFCARVGVDYQVLVLIGERGCGKTYAAADWLWMTEHRWPDALARKVTPRRFLEAPLLVETPYEERTSRFGFAKALVVDDVGTEKDFLVPDIAAVMIQRYRNALPTVITTNLSQEDFAERYGMRFADRMNEVGRFVVVSNDPGDSLRGKELK